MDFMDRRRPGGSLKKTGHMSVRKMPTIPSSVCSIPGLIVGLAASVAILACGCGKPSHFPDLGDVSGTVTLDGRPLDKVNVAFEPGEGRPSIGVTDAQGRYTLQFVGGYNGAIVGRHTVRIGTEGYVLGPDGTDEFVAESLPPAYNKQSTLAADVKPGQNTFNFELSSKPAGSE
jgi:hypothetical protein